MASSTRPPQTFDLGSLAARDRSWKRPGLYLVIALLVGFGLELVDFLATEPGAVLTGPWTELSVKVDAGVDATLVFFIGLLAASVPRFLPGASSLRVDDEALQIVYPAGRSLRLPWKDASMRFYLRDNSAHPRLVEQGSRYFLYVPSTRYPGRDRRFRLPDDAFDEIVRRARERGASVRTTRGTGLWNGYPPQIHWIRGRSH